MDQVAKMRESQDLTLGGGLRLMPWKRCQVQSV
jgi:hypothetical protein